MICLENVRLDLASAAGTVNILRGIDLAVDSGETVGVVGPSGSGKSTMMMIIGGLERPTAGRVAVAGTELDRLSEDALARFRRDAVGIVFQAFHLIPTMTALENVAMPLELAGRSAARGSGRA
jgi:putative ABC transport system ATP-binding protein